MIFTKEIVTHADVVVGFIDLSTGEVKKMAYDKERNGPRFSDWESVSLESKYRICSY